MITKDKSYLLTCWVLLFCSVVLCGAQNFWKITQFSQTEKPNVNEVKVKWCTINAAEQQKCLNFAMANMRDQIRVGYKWFKISCKQASNKDECMQLLDQGNADLTTLDAGEVFVGGRYHSLVPISQEVLEGGFKHYYAVAVIKKGTLQEVNSLFDLRDKKACFAGVTTFAGWILPIYTLMKQGGMDIVDCNNHVKTATKYFGPSCAVNCLTDKFNPIGDNSDKLCQLCTGKVPGGRCTDTDPYAGYNGAFRCLLEAGDVAFLKHSTVAEMAAGLEFSGISKESFELLCKDGSRQPIDNHLSCYWGKVPSDAIVASSALPFDERKLLQTFLEKAATLYSNKNHTGGFQTDNRNAYDRQNEFDQYGRRRNEYDQFGNRKQPGDFDQFDQNRGNANRFKRQDFYDQYRKKDEQSTQNTNFDQFGQPIGNRDQQNNQFNQQNRDNLDQFGQPRDQFGQQNRDQFDQNRDRDQNQNRDQFGQPTRDQFGQPRDRDQFGQPNNQFDPNRDQFDEFGQPRNQNRSQFGQQNNNRDQFGRTTDRNNQDPYRNDPFARDPQTINRDQYGINIDPYDVDPNVNRNVDRNREQFNFNNGVPIDGPIRNLSAINFTNIENFSLFESSPRYGIQANLLFQDATRAIAPVPENQQTYSGFLGESLEVIMGVRDCPVGRMTLCVTSDAEIEKCVKMKTALKAQLLKPEMDCYKGHSQINCMQAIRAGTADVTILDASDVYTAGLNYDLLPFISEVYNLVEPEYYVVAVAKESDPDTELTYLKGKYTCHGGINTAAGWVIPMAFLLSNGWIRPYGCDSIRAAAEYFQKSCVPGALSSEYNTGVPYDNMCDLCHGSSFRTCRRDASEDYYGHTGAFRCLVEGGGHVAFVKHTTVTENTGGKKREWWARDNLNDDYELLCTDGTRREIHEYEKCNLGKVKANAVVTRGGYGYNETSINAFINLFLYAQTFYGRKTTDEFSFSMFSSAPPFSDLIFQDATTQLKIIPLEKRHYANYLGGDFMRARRITDCYAGSSNLKSSLLTLGISILVALFSYNFRQ